MYTVIFEADTRAGQWFDRGLIVVILASIAIVLLDSVESIGTCHQVLFNVLEWIFTLLFTLEYLARMVCARQPLRPEFLWRY